jgi:uncharacterized small protein (DUF1192 family)
MSLSMVGTAQSRLCPPYISGLPAAATSGACIMSNESSLSLAELNDRIRILEDNIRQLIEQAAAASGERNEARIADRLSQQNEELERLTQERDARSKK